MIKNAGSAALKRERKNPQTLHSHESALRSRIINPDQPRIKEHLNKLKLTLKEEKEKLEVTD